MRINIALSSVEMSCPNRATHPNEGDEEGFLFRVENYQFACA